jgi:uncharacterized protein (DUF488 family)
MRIETLGYARWTMAEVAAHVRDVDGWLIDVRLQPYSSKPGFRKPDLDAELGGRYRHMPAFGNEAYDADGEDVRLRNVWRGIAQLEDASPLPSTLVLMCGCADWRSCHRRHVATHLADAFDAEVEHLSPPGNPSQPSLFEE